MPSCQLICQTCGYKAKRPLMDQAGSRGHHETACEPARCPHGHGALKRVDGYVQELMSYGMYVVTGHRSDSPMRKWDRVLRSVGARRC